MLNQWCFVSKEGHISHCSCKFKNCGCEDDSAAIPAPTCDNKEVPKVSDSNFTISSIGTTYYILKLQHYLNLSLPYLNCFYRI